MRWIRTEEQNTSMLILKKALARALLGSIPGSLPLEKPAS
jgi:hypothetical protein